MRVETRSYLSLEESLADVDPGAVVVGVGEGILCAMVSTIR